MAESAVGITIQVLLENLLTISQEQISLVWDFKDDLDTLKKSFSMIQYFLHDAGKKQVNDDAVKRWLKDLEAMAFYADNVLDEINYRILSKKVGATNNKTMMEKLQSFFSSSNNPITYRLKLGHRIRDLNEKLISLNRMAKDYGLQIIVGQDQVYGADASANRETDSFSEDPITLGRENDISRIVEMLITTSTSPVDRKLSVLPIVGMGGLGKTTLARLVFGQANIKTHFETRVWVNVPRNFDVVVLLKSILTSMTTKYVEHYNANREALLQKLQNNLGAKKYLLVLDDVWDEDGEVSPATGMIWDDFVNSISGISSCTGNCMIVTTRSEEVAPIVETLPVHKLKGLSGDDCWSIIKAKAFRGRDNPLELETIGINIANRCKGLPLAAKVVGGLLFSKSKYEWMSIEKNWLSDYGDDTNMISKILKLSFDNLPSPLVKICFAYCSIFPKGYLIEKEQLIELWMGEGFLQNRHQRSNINMETTGSRIFNILVQNSFLQKMDYDDIPLLNSLQMTDYDGIPKTYYNMHDLVHDLSCSILCENDNVTDDICQSRYIGYKYSGDKLVSITKGQARYVRTLFFNGKVSDIRFSDFESLRTLTLVDKDTDDLPTSVRELKHLRYLDISKTGIQYLPDSIGELYHLQTLRAGEGYLKKLPDSLSCLICLRHLHISYKYTTLPPEIGKLTSLQTLPYFHVDGEKGCGISELGNLKDLKGELEIRDLEKVRDKNEAMSADLIRKTSIHKLKLVWGISTEGNESTEGNGANDENVLEGLQPHPNLMILEISKFKGKSLPPWTSKMAVQLDGKCWEGLNNLVDIKLDCCHQCEELPMLGHLRNLKSIRLRRLVNLKSIRSSFYGINDNLGKSGNNISHNGVSTTVVFPKLERLVLLNMPNLKEWDEAGDMPLQPSEVLVFPRLQYLTIHECMQLTRAPSHFPCLGELIIDKMESSLPLENICGMKLTSLTHLALRGIKELECLPNGLFSNNHYLSKLEIISCPKMTHLVPFLRGGGSPSLKVLKIETCSSLRELPDDLHSLNSLETLVIDGCPDLKSIPYPSSRGGHESRQQGFTSLKELYIRNCKGLTNLSIEMVVSCALSLETLSLIWLNSLTNLSEVIECMHKMTCLKSLNICGVPKFSISSGIQVFSCLKRFLMSPLDSSWNNVSFNETFDAMFLQPPQILITLRNVSLTGMDHWECLPDQLQHLTSLEILSLWSFGIEALPEWFGNLSSLTRLELVSCKKLRYFPSKQAMQRLSKLARLYIEDSPLLLKGKRPCNNNYYYSDCLQIVDSEWPKISHICTIRVDHNYIFHYRHQSPMIPCSGINILEDEFSCSVDELPVEEKKQLRDKVDRELLLARAGDKRGGSTRI